MRLGRICMASFIVPFPLRHRYCLPLNYCQCRCESILITRKHSSRMRTDRLLTVSRSIREGGLPRMQTPPSKGMWPVMLGSQPRQTDKHECASRIWKLRFLIPFMHPSLNSSVCPPLFRAVMRK